jgi:protein tyrosine/serine phosphatase
MTRPAGPIRASYWVVEGKLLAGEYPGAYTDDAARAKLSLFLDVGIRTFVDLTEPSEPLRSYDDALTRLALERGITCKHLRFGIADRGVPGAELLAQVLAAIRQEISEDRPVYVHCWGGIGRTGTIIGCWVAESGLSGEDAIAQLADLRRDNADRARPSTETDLQRQCICEWKARTE